MRKRVRWIVLGVASIAGAVGLAALGGNAEASGGCVCPRIYAPVACSNGRTYTNPCVATCNHATDCVAVTSGYTPPIPKAAKRSALTEEPE